MTRRMLFAACAAVALQASVYAQSPPSAPPAPLPPPPPALAPGSCVTYAPLVNADGLDEGCRGPRFWVDGEYLFAWVQGFRLPPLVTTSPVGTARTAAGILGLPTTSTVFGGNMVNNDLRSGARIDAGYWFTPERKLGVEGGFMIVESQATLFSASSAGTPILARPYFDVTTNSPQAVLVAFPGVSSGTIDSRVNSGNFYGANFDLVENFLDLGWMRLNSMIGYRFYRYDEGLRFRQNLTPTDPSFAAGTLIAAADDFTAQNEFHGGDLGFRTQFFWQRLSLGILTKFALGNVHNRVIINGSTTTTVPGAAPTTAPGGVLALGSNIGSFSQNTWTVLPELGVNLGWQIRKGVRLNLGYNLLFLNEIARAPSQVDFHINPGLFPPATGTGPASPAFTLNQSNIWIQSINAGLTFSF